MFTAGAVSSVAQLSLCFFFPPLYSAALLVRLDGLRLVNYWRCGDEIRSQKDYFSDMFLSYPHSFVSLSRSLSFSFSFLKACCILFTIEKDRNLH